MKRFLLFEYDDYYPEGGLHDLMSAHDTLAAAVAAATVVVRSDFGHDQGDENREIADLETLEIVRAWRAVGGFEDGIIGVGGRHLAGKPCKLRRFEYQECEVRGDDA